MTFEIDSKDFEEKLGEIFINSGIISESDLLGVLELQLGLNRVYIDMIKVDKEVVNLVPEFLAKKYDLLTTCGSDFHKNGDLFGIKNEKSKKLINKIMR